MKSHLAPTAPAAGARRLVALLLVAGTAAAALGLHDPHHAHESDFTGAAGGELIAACASDHPRGEHFEAQHLVRSAPCPACWLSHAGLGDAGDGAAAFSSGDGGSRLPSGRGQAAAGNSPYHPSPRAPPAG